SCITHTRRVRLPQTARSPHIHREVPSDIYSFSPEHSIPPPTMDQFTFPKNISVGRNRGSSLTDMLAAARIDTTESKNVSINDTDTGHGFNVPAPIRTESPSEFAPFPTDTHDNNLHGLYTDTPTREAPLLSRSSSQSDETDADFKGIGKKDSLNALRQKGQTKIKNSEYHLRCYCTGKRSGYKMGG
ncbi:hypothetical protein BCR34DRAFT_645379, partial [Clohesyomyces aquaticus]